MNKTFSILSAADARSVDYEAIHEIGIPSLVLMEHAASQSVNVIKQYISNKDKICVACGPGNNGADGLAIARLLSQEGYDAQILLCAPRCSADEQIQLDIVKKLDIPFVEEVNLIQFKADMHMLKVTQAMREMDGVV